ncbi:hypothetical protein MMC22_009329 [Lobaria immixta]|nr:hypothetical protein [Lobaria immixta]
MTASPPHWNRLGLFILTIAFLESVHGWPASAAGNVTIESNNNDPKVHCDRTRWYDICWFFFANYILHALSVRSLPGENFYLATVFKLCCLLVPYTGLRRGLCLISRAGNLAGNDLQAAARANALCMVIRKPDWRPRIGDEVSGCQLEVHSLGANDTPASDAEKESHCELTSTGTAESGSSGTSSEQGNRKDEKALHIQVTDVYKPPLCRGLVNKLAEALIETYHFRSKTPTCSIVDHDSVKIQGRCELSEGYALAYVPADMEVYPRNSFTSNNASPGLLPQKPRSQTRLASAHDFPRILFSLTQTVSGAYALYRARGSQIERYGFAAFGLTVLPFIVISILNLLGSLLTREYETIFLVHSSSMDEMTDRGGILDGAVGSIHAPAEDEAQIPIGGGREGMDTSGINVIFGGSEDSLTCRDSTTQSDRLESYSIQPWATPMPAKRCGWRLFLSRLMLGPFQTPNPLQQVTVNSRIIIPSHPPFSRLPPPSSQIFMNMLSIILLVIAFATPYIVIGILSGFKANHATGNQRTFTLNWLISGQISGYAIGNIEKLTKNNTLKGLIFVFVCYGSYCLGALVVVAQEMIEFGTCKAD